MRKKNTKSEPVSPSSILPGDPNASEKRREILRSAGLPETIEPQPADPRDLKRQQFLENRLRMKALLRMNATVEEIRTEFGLATPDQAMNYVRKLLGAQALEAAANLTESANKAQMADMMRESLPGLREVIKAGPAHRQFMPTLNLIKEYLKKDKGVEVNVNTQVGVVMPSKEIQETCRAKIKDLMAQQMEATKVE